MIVTVPFKETPFVRNVSHEHKNSETIESNKNVSPNLCSNQISAGSDTANSYSFFIEHRRKFGTEFEKNSV